MTYFTHRIWIKRNFIRDKKLKILKLIFKTKLFLHFKTHFIINYNNQYIKYIQSIYITEIIAITDSKLFVLTGGSNIMDFSK